jgi:uncharacterized protein YaaW (UPF0174 family)
MNTKYYKEIEQMIVSARNMNDAELDRMVDQCLAEISEEDKNEFCEALAAFHVDRIHKYMEVNNELTKLRQPNVRKETVNKFEMAY